LQNFKIFSLPVRPHTQHEDILFEIFPDSLMDEKDHHLDS